MMNLSAILLLLVYGVVENSANFITVDAHTEKCFSDKVEAGTKMRLTFDVVEGGFLDIDVRIVGPDSKVIYQGERETSGKYTFLAHAQGVYTYCFSNKIHTITYKVVKFRMAIGESPKAESQATGGEDTTNKRDQDRNTRRIRRLANTTPGW